MASIQELFDFALERVPDAAKICVKWGDEEILVERYSKAAPPPQRTEDIPAAPEKSGPEIAGDIVKAPLVGVFYAAPKPDAEPFVGIGSRVEKGTVLCVIEAMKMFNEIESTCAGTVARLLVENGDMVEFGQPLFEITP